MDARDANSVLPRERSQILQLTFLSLRFHLRFHLLPFFNEVFVFCKQIKMKNKK